MKTIYSHIILMAVSECGWNLTVFTVHVGLMFALEVTDITYTNLLHIITPGTTLIIKFKLKKKMQHWNVLLNGLN